MVMYTMIVTSTLHFGWCYLFVFIFNWEIIGVSLATIITYFSNFALITFYCKYGTKDKDIKKSFFFVTKESFRDT